MTPPLTAQLLSANRELTRRLTVYPRVVKEGRMSQDQADSEIACQRAIIKLVERAIHLEEATREMMGPVC